MQIEDLWGAVLAGVVSSLIFLGLHLGTGGKGMGLGDVKFVLVMGLLLGWQRMIVGTLLAFVLGALVGMGLLLPGKKKLSKSCLLAPFWWQGQSFFVVGQQFVELVLEDAVRIFNYVFGGLFIAIIIGMGGWYAREKIVLTVASHQLKNDLASLKRLGI
jgi:hypothetical protein